MRPCDGDIFVRQGLRFKVSIERDDDATAPWVFERLAAVMAGVLA